MVNHHSVSLTALSLMQSDLDGVELKVRWREFLAGKSSSSPFFKSLETRGDQIKEVKNG